MVTIAIFEQKHHLPDKMWLTKAELNIIHRMMAEDASKIIDWDQFEDGKQEVEARWKCTLEQLRRIAA